MDGQTDSYHAATNTWNSLAPLSIGKSESAVAFLGSTIISAGGLANSGAVVADTEGYNVATNSWTTLVSMPTARQGSERLFQSGSAEPALAEQVRYFRMSKDRRSLYFLRFTDGEQLVQVKLPSKEEGVVWTFTDPLSASDSWSI